MQLGQILLKRQAVIPRQVEFQCILKATADERGSLLHSSLEPLSVDQAGRDDGRKGVAAATAVPANLRRAHDAIWPAS